MINKKAMESSNKLARTTGILYLLVILLGVVSEGIVHNFIIVPGDITATVNHIIDYETIFRFGFVISLTRFVVYILLVLALYKLFDR
jgi:hypothetical protein